MKKPLDKLARMWYNKYRKGKENPKHQKGKDYDEHSIQGNSLRRHGRQKKG